MEKKLTKKSYFEILRAMIEQDKSVGDVPADDILKFIDNEIAILNKKTASAKKRAAEKKIKDDELTAAIKMVLTTEYQNADEILAQIEGEDVTKAKVTSRLNKLVKSGEVEKESLKDEETKRKLMNYKLIAFAVEDEGEDQ